MLATCEPSNFQAGKTSLKKQFMGQKRHPDGKFKKVIGRSQTSFATKFEYQDRTDAASKVETDQNRLSKLIPSHGSQWQPPGRARPGPQHDGPAPPGDGQTAPLPLASTSRRSVLSSEVPAACAGSTLSQEDGLPRKSWPLKGVDRKRSWESGQYSPEKPEDEEGEAAGPGSAVTGCPLGCPQWTVLGSTSFPGVAECSGQGQRRCVQSTIPLSAGTQT